MSRMKLNHWFVNDNGLEIALMRFYIKTKVFIKDQKQFCVLEVIDSKQNKEVFEFNTLEEAVSFTEDTIIECKKLEEIPTKYKEQLIDNKKENNDEGYFSITLSKAEIYKIIIDYFGEGRPRVSAKHTLEMKDNKLDINFFLVEEFVYRRKRQITETRLSEEDLKEAFEKYLEDSGYQFVKFEYVGGIRRVGYFVDEDTPHFDGIKIYIKGREKIRK